MENTSSETAVSPWKMGWIAARANLVPGLVLQAVAVALLVAYYGDVTVCKWLQWAGFPQESINWLLSKVHIWREWLQVVADLKKEWSFQWCSLYTAISAGTFCGIIPWLFRMAIPSLRPRLIWKELAFGFIYWAAICQTTDQFYQFQARVWDYILNTKDANDWYVVFIKTACDMLIFTPIIAAPCNSISHLWKEKDFSFSATREALRGRWYRNIVMPNLVPNWMVWTPGIAVTYSLPGLLQVPMANLIGCFWALLCITIAAKTKKTQ